MDLVLRDRSSGAPLTILPASPVSGYLTVELNEHLWGPDQIIAEMDANVARSANIMKGQLIQFSDLIFLIEQIHIGPDNESRVSALATVTGYDPVSVPRSMQPTSGQSHDIQDNVAGETAMKHFVEQNLGSFVDDPERAWDLLAIEADGARGEIGSWRARYQQLVDMLTLIAQETGLGFQTAWNGTLGENGMAEFTVIQGQHRDRLLAIAEGTVRREELLTTDSDRLTYVYVAGQGEGAARTIVERFLATIEPAELLRREVFVDARDTNDVETLESRGDGKLAETQLPDAVELELQEFDGWRYNVEFSLGDTLNYRSQFLSADRIVRIVEVKTNWNESLVSPDRTVVLDRPFPDVSDRERLSGGTQFQ